MGDLKKQVGGFFEVGFVVFFFSFFHKYESFPQPSNSWLLNTLLQLGNSRYLNKQTDGRAGTRVGRSYLARGAPWGMLTSGHSRGQAPGRQGAPRTCTATHQCPPKKWKWSPHAITCTAEV